MRRGAIASLKEAACGACAAIGDNCLPRIKQLPLFVKKIIKLYLYLVYSIISSNLDLDSGRIYKGGFHVLGTRNT